MGHSPRVIESIESLRPLVGQEVAASDWMAIEQPRIDQFATATGDHQWIHVDQERAKRDSPYRGTIAHGFLTLSMLSTLSAQALELQGNFKMRINYGLNRVRFPAPVLTGSRIRARFTLQSMEDLAESVQLTWAVLVEAEGSQKPVLAAEWLVRYYR